MPSVGGWEWLIVLAIVLLVFGVGRVGRVGGELGRAIREFRKGLTGDESPDDKPKDDSKSGGAA